MESLKLVRGIAVIAVILICTFMSYSYAELVQYDLFSIGCPTSFGSGIYWSSDFDLGVEFSQINSVSIDWAGEITGGRAAWKSDPDHPFPIDVGIYCGILDNNGWPRMTDVFGGADTYPNPEFFDQISEIKQIWSALLDGTGKITIDYTEYYLLDGHYIEHGLVTLTKATLVVDGTVVPEPLTVMLMSLGTVLLRKHKL